MNPKIIELEQPFWIFQDIGDGEQWQLAFLQEDDMPEVEFPDRKRIVYPLKDFNDYWYPDEAEDFPVKPCNPPEGEPED